MQAAPATASARQLLAGAAPRLQAAGIDTARLDAEVLLAWAMNLGRAGLYARLDDSIEDAAARRFEGALRRRERREPAAYITGTQEFWSLPFAVSPAVLIPRPETELLVELISDVAGPTAARRRLALPRAGAEPREGERSGEPRAEPIARILDLGTGSGCIAVALARELPAAHVMAIDLSSDALAIARANAHAHGVTDRIDFHRGDLFEPLPPAARFDVIVSNPPYLAPDDPASPELTYEPAAALMAGADGLAVIHRIIAEAPARLRPGGWLMMELGQGQAAAVLALARAAGFVFTHVEPDLAGIPRALVARTPAST